MNIGLFTVVIIISVMIMKGQIVIGLIFLLIIRVKFLVFLLVKFMVFILLTTLMILFILIWQMVVRWSSKVREPVLLTVSGRLLGLLV